jgi:hypothetical protein
MCKLKPGSMGAPKDVCVHARVCTWMNLLGIYLQGLKTPSRDEIRMCLVTLLESGDISEGVYCTHFALR